MNKKGIYMLSSRRDPITKFKHFTPYKNLKIAKGSSGSTVDLGKFDEGYCTSVTSFDETLIVCFDKIINQTNFIFTVGQYSGKFSFADNKQVDFQAQMSPRDSLILSDYPVVGKDGLAVNTKLDPNAPPVQKHSYWRLLQSWSTCSVACGGGSSTRQL